MVLEIRKHLPLTGEVNWKSTSKLAGWYKYPTFAVVIFGYINLPKTIKLKAWQLYNLLYINYTLMKNTKSNVITVIFQMWLAFRTKLSRSWHISERGILGELSPGSAVLWQQHVLINVDFLPQKPQNEVIMLLYQKHPHYFYVVSNSFKILGLNLTV